MKLTTRQLALCALLTAMALALSYMENFFPLSLVIPLPGIKLGLANIVTVFALYVLGPAQAMSILVARCFLGSLFAGNLNAMLFSMLGGVAAVVTNTVLNYALIFGKLGLPEMGVRGAAVATVISRYVELALIVAVTHLRRKRYFYFVGLYRTMKVPLLLVKRIVIRGLPLLANESLWSVGLSFLTQLYSLRGLDVIAGINIASTVTNLFNTISFAMGNAVAIMVGQALGADEVERAKKTSGRLITFGTLVAAGMALLLCVVSPYIPLLYNTTDRVRTLATQFMLILALNMPLQAFGHCCYFTLRSGGKTIMTFIFDCMSVWVLSVPVVYALVHYTDMSIQWIYTICQLLNIIKCVFGFWLVKKGVWIHNITLETKEA